MKLAILETDVLRPEHQPTFVGYGRMFLNLFEAVGVDWEMEVFPVIHDQYPLDFDRFDAFLVTGSKHDAFADDDWIVRLRDYVRTLYDHGKPMVGICFGHQLLAHALGGRAERFHQGWGLGVMSYEVLEQPAFADNDQPVSLLVSHRDQVTAIPPQARPLLTNPFCEHAAFYIPGKVLCFQGHPEFTKEYEQVLLPLRESDVPPEQMSAIRDSMEDPHEGVRIGQWMKRFLEQTVQR
ncbi:glutamine amidotransferase-related protein [Saccharospirillum salsuginis]|uniref:Amidotransferase n=1 Tax=Saccharospirillum salsuginis TaxID=418750 RepID=A0A918K425_9GAMM|nr:amidotransferase [Saccharospirillum salsuginis]GGX48367.1 amidotransferase [Saccharospirillum salsuginis]